GVASRSCHRCPRRSSLGPRVVGWPIKGGTHMKKHDEARRAFLVGAAVSAGAALAPDAHAESRKRTAAAKAAVQADTHSHASSGGHGAFLNEEDAATITAFSERLWPAAPGKPGASEAGVLNYIDLALAGAYAEQQDFYRRGLAALDTYCRKTYNQSFAAL